MNALPVYSIDECFIDCTCYLHAYRKEADKLNTNPAHVMAMTMIRDVLRTTGITATVGIGTNLYLAKVAMDIVAKKQPADRDGVRIAELNEDSYKFLLWDHKPLTDFWQIGNGKARRLEKAYMFTMGDIAARTQWDEEFFYKTFGIDGEILVDHAWGIEPVTMADIKSYKSDGHSLSNGQVLSRPYKYQEARLVFREMIEVLCTDMFSKNLVTQGCSWWVSYDYKSLDVCPSYVVPPKMFFSMIKKPAVSIRANRLEFSMSAIRLFEGVQYILPMLSQKKKRMVVAICAEEELSSVEWARLKKDKWVNRSITCPEYAQNIYQMMDWKKDCRYKVYGRLANSERGLVLVFDLGSAVMFDPLPEEYFDKRSGKMKKRINKYYPDEIRMKLGRSYSDYEATQRRSSFESLSGYMDTSGSAVPSTISEEVAASISMKDQERKRETLYGTMIGNGGDEDG